MMMNKRLIRMLRDGKKYVAGNVIAQWLSLAANMVLIFQITAILQDLADRQLEEHGLIRCVITAGIVLAVRYLCACRKERGSSVLASVVKRRIRRGDPFPLPDYVYDLHTLTGQERGRNIDHFLAEAACVRPGVRATAEELEEPERWERQLVALMKEEEAQQDRT